MSNNLNYKINSRTKNQTTVWEATVSIPGTKPTKVVQKTTGCSEFSTRSAVMSSVKSLAKKLGFADVTDTAVKAAAKKSVATKTVATPSVQ